MQTPSSSEPHIEPHWQPGETGFLIQPGPLCDLSAAAPLLPPESAAHIEDAAAHLPQWITAGTVRAELERLPLWQPDGAALATIDGRAIERLFMLYGYFASAYILSPPHQHDHLPPTLAVPLAALAQHVGRPPMLSYTAQVLTNWRLRDPAQGLTPDNIDVQVRFTTLEDERWFFAVHTSIEARGGALLQALRQGMRAAADQDEAAALKSLRQLQRGLIDITRLFHRMPEHCEPRTYYLQVRPFLFGFDGVRFDDVPALAEPQTLRGGSGAQSSLVPALLAGLGVDHAQTALTHHLNAMHPYMPRAHREFIRYLRQSTLREYARQRLALRHEYNNALQRLMTFRRAHLHYARTYIFALSSESRGTGGTDFMRFLSQLIEETDHNKL